MGWRTGCSEPCPGASSGGCCSGSRCVGTRELVFVDEPTTGLDAEVRRTLWATLRRLAATGRGVVLTTHYLEEADALADRIVLLHEGRVIAEGTPSQIKSSCPGGGSPPSPASRQGRRPAGPGCTTPSETAPGWKLLVSEPEPVLRELLHRDQSVTGVTVTEPTPRGRVPDPDRQDVGGSMTTIHDRAERPGCCGAAPVHPPQRAARVSHRGLAGVPQVDPAADLRPLRSRCR